MGATTLALESEELRALRFEKMESVFHISNYAPENQVKFATCTFIRNALTWWNSHMKVVTQDVAYAMDCSTKKDDGQPITPRELALMCGRMFPEELDEVEKYVGGLPDMIRGNVMSYQPQIMEKAIEFANDQYGQNFSPIKKGKLNRKGGMEYNVGKQSGHPPTTKQGQNTGRAELTYWVCEKREYTRSSGPNNNNNNRGNSGATQNSITCYECGVQGHIKRDALELGSFDVIVGMDWLAKYHAVIDCAKKIVCIPWGNETLIVHGDGSNQGNETRLNIISCTKTHKYFLKGHHVFLANVTSKETEDRSGEKRLEDVPIVQDFPEVFPKELRVFQPDSTSGTAKLILMLVHSTVARAPLSIGYSEKKVLSEQLQETYRQGLYKDQFLNLGSCWSVCQKEGRITSGCVIEYRELNNKLTSEVLKNRYLSQGLMICLINYKDPVFTRR
ncbi:putative reverse transcriptase domain-containing protein [Tanacetum coccineum]